MGKYSAPALDDLDDGFDADAFPSFPGDTDAADYEGGGGCVLWPTGGCPTGVTPRRCGRSAPTQRLASSAETRREWCLWRLHLG